MSFIQEKLNSVGPVNYVSYYHDNIAGTDGSNQFRDEQIDVVADPNNCHVNYRWRIARDGQVGIDQPAWFDLKDVTKIMVMSREQDMDEINAANGHPSWSSRVTPSVFTLRLKKTGNGLNIFRLADEELANRVAKAFMHAVELCGGGDKDPF